MDAVKTVEFRTMPYVPAGPVSIAFAFASVPASSVSAAGSVLVAFNNASFSTSAPFRIRRESRSASCGKTVEINSLLANSQRNVEEKDTVAIATTER